MPLLARRTKTKEFKGVKQHLKTLLIHEWQRDVMDRALIQCPRLPTVHAGEMVAVHVHRGIKRFAVWQLTTSNQALLLQLTQVPINRGQSHRNLSILQGAMKLLATDFITKTLQLIKKLFLPRIDRTSLNGHGAVRSMSLLAQSNLIAAFVP
jgi:hypothetical protein